MGTAFVVRIFLLVRGAKLLVSPYLYIYKRDYVIVTWLGHFFERICQLMT